MKSSKILAFFSVLSSLIFAQSNAILVKIENNSNEPLTALKSITSKTDILQYIDTCYIKNVIIKIQNQYDQVIEQKLNMNDVSLEQNNADLDQSKKNKTSTEVHIPKDWTIKHIELICNNVSYPFSLNNQQINILHKKDITFFFDHIIDNNLNIKFRPRIAIM